METKSIKLEWTLSDLAGSFGITTGVLGGLLTALDVLDNPRARWIVWGTSALLLTYAGLKLKDIRANFLQDGSIEKQRHRYFFGAFIFVALLVADVLTSFLRAPIDHTELSVSTPVEVGFTSSSEDNILLKEDVHHVKQTLTPIEIEQGPFFGFIAKTEFVKTKGIDYLVIHQCKVKVVRYAEMPPFLQFGAAAGQMDALNVQLTIKRLDTQLPWEFKASDFAYNGDAVELPFVVDDFAPTLLRYFIDSSDAGIYWVEAEIVVSDGIGRKREITLTDRPIPLAFFRDETEASGLTELDALLSDEWVPFPLLSDEQKQSRIKQVREWSNPDLSIELDTEELQTVPPAPQLKVR